MEQPQAQPKDLLSRVGERLQRQGIGVLRLATVFAGGLLLASMDQLSVPSVDVDDSGVDILSQYADS
ncbi:hypothetical protein KC976_00280 [Candidatus Saccharibacteria bacterium]|nr:hypothetical protein [Candidatus Saccharibacteria bacterium]